MKMYLLLFVTFLFLCFSDVFFLSVSPDVAKKQIGEKIWKNECRSTIKGLTTWSKGENFGSFGIGHFIWYAQGKREHFQETFPALLAFLQDNGIQLPAWLKRAQACPWNSREEFYQQMQSPEMISLRKLLYDTRNLQALFIANRLKKDLEMLCTFSSEQKNRGRFFSIVKRSEWIVCADRLLQF